VRYVARCLVVLGTIVLGPPAAQAAPITLVDTLGIATTTTQFNVAPSVGLSIGFVNDGLELVFGPGFTLTGPTVITEIGAFIEPCLALGRTGGPCPAPPLPAVVDIHPDLNGVPNLATVIASFTLSNDGDPFLFSFESVAPNFLLGAGSYFALFNNQQPGVTGAVLSGAEIPFFYSAGISFSAQVNTVTGEVFILRPPETGEPASGGAVRILGQTVPEPSTFVLLGSALIGLTGLRRRTRARLSR
jgi:PEP-CTERM motif